MRTHAFALARFSTVGAGAASPCAFGWRSVAVNTPDAPEPPAARAPDRWTWAW